MRGAAASEGPMTYDSTQENFLRFEKLVWRTERPDFGFERSDLGRELVRGAAAPKGPMTYAVFI